MQAVPQLSNIRQVSDGWIKKYVLAYTMPDGSTYEYESASRKSLEAYRAELEGNAAGRACAADAVCIVPQTATGELLLIREFRYPLNSWCIAFPAGLMEPGEDLATCVDRELREETGYALRADADAPALDPLPQAGYSSTGLTDETVHVVFAQVEKVADAQPEPAEFIEPFLLPIADVPRFLAENETPIGTRAQLVLEAFARFAGQLHEQGIEHRDFNHGNVLWRRDTATGAIRFQLIDINRMRFADRPLRPRACMVNLRRLSCPAVAFLFILDRYAEARGWNIDDTLLQGTFFRLAFGRRKELRKRFRRRKR